MEHEPNNNPGPERDELAERRRAKRRQEALDALPPPREAAGIITAILEEEAHTEVLEALANGRPIDDATARVIAYSLVAHAPEDAPTDALLTYFVTGTGTHDAISAEYLPLYENPVMKEEGRLLLDWLGTHLFNQEHHANLTAADQAMDGVVAFGTTADAQRHTVAFAHSGELEEPETTALAHRLLLLAGEHGDGFRAYLRVPGVDALSPTLLDDFHQAYIADPADEDTNRERITSRTDLQWAAVAIGGGIHVFIR